MAIFHNKFDNRVNFSKIDLPLGDVHFHDGVTTAGEQAQVVTRIDAAKLRQAPAFDVTEGPVTEAMRAHRRLHLHRRAS